jgi:hypothetical protein
MSMSEMTTKERMRWFGEIYRRCFPLSERPLSDPASLPASIECPVCHSVSFHPEDVRNGYCAYCHDFTTPTKPKPKEKDDAQ